MRFRVINRVNEDIVMKKFAKAVAGSYSLAEVIRKLGLRPAGSNYDLAKTRIKTLGFDTAHFTGRVWNKGKKSTVRMHRSLDEILVKDSTYMSTHHLKNRLIAEGIFIHQCVSCKRTMWLGQDIPLELDHINGDRRDNRLENLRLLCPNCHALTETYRGKNKGRITIRSKQTYRIVTTGCENEGRAAAIFPV